MFSGDCINRIFNKTEIRELITYAKGYGIEIIPDFDSPGHLKQVLATHPEWCLPNATGGVDARALNILDQRSCCFHPRDLQKNTQSYL